MARISSTFASVVLILLAAKIDGALAQEQPTYIERSGLELTCYARHARSGQRVPVVGVNGNANGYFGYATYNANGWPTIIFDARLLSRYPEFFARFTYYHECAHLAVPTSDEILANCRGLTEMRRNRHISRREERTLGEIHNTFGRLEAKYGGSGRELWELTLECAGPF